MSTEMLRISKKSNGMTWQHHLQINMLLDLGISWGKNVRKPSLDLPTSTSWKTSQSGILILSLRGTWNNISRNKPRTGGSTSNTLTGQETCAKSCCKCFSLSATGTCNVLYVFGTHESANIFGKQFIFLGVSVIYYIVLSQHFLSYCCGFVDHVATLKSLEKNLEAYLKHI